MKHSEMTLYHCLCGRIFLSDTDDAYGRHLDGCPVYWKAYETLKAKTKKPPASVMASEQAVIDKKPTPPQSKPQ